MLVLFHLSILLKIRSSGAIWGGQLPGGSKVYASEGVSLAVSLICLIGPSGQSRAWAQAIAGTLD